MTFELELSGITVGGFTLRFYSVMILAGLALGIVLARYHARRLGEDPEHVVNIAVLGAVFGIIGARLYHVIDQQEWPRYRADPIDIIRFWDGGVAGLGIFGAVAGALLALLLYVRWKRLDLLRYLDIGAISFLLGQAVGRWGNFFNQELFGPPTDLPWGIPIPANHVLREAPQYLGSTHFHPLFLYESLLNGLGVALMVWLFARYGPRMVDGVLRTPEGWHLRPGDMLLIYFLWYPAVRFVLEFLRTDPWTEAGVPMAQWIGGGLFLGAGALLWWRHRRTPGPTPHVPARERRSRTARRRARQRTP